MWQNFMLVCWLKNVQVTLLDDRLKLTLKTVFLLPIKDNNQYHNNYAVAVMLIYHTYSAQQSGLMVAQLREY